VGAPGRFRTESGLEIAVAGPAAQQRLLAVRPERIRLGPANGAANRFPATVEFVSYLGATTEYVVRLASGDLLAVETHNTRADGAAIIEVGSAIEVSWDPDASQLIA
jgi:putative spermidine/putrescine transport system ATP-binding protein